MSVVHAVVVAYNRATLLTATLQALLDQHRPPDVIHVIDNASTDGTADLVRTAFPQVRLQEIPVNTGGAGGFAAGLAVAIDGGARLVWLMDDDTVPRPSALSELLTAYFKAPDPKPVMLASRVVWTDGRDHPMNTPRVRPGVTTSERAAAAGVGCLPVRSASFVSMLVDAEAVAAVGLPLADFFLWNDDFEFSTRLVRDARGWYCPASVVEHHTKQFGDTDNDPGDRFYFEVRNKLWTFRRSDGLRPHEKLMYGGSTLARWARTFRRSTDRPRLWAAMRRGFVDGTRRAPRDTKDVLREAGVDLP